LGQVESGGIVLGSARSFFGEDLCAQLDAPVADVDPRSRDQPLDLVAVLATKRAAQRPCWLVDASGSRIGHEVNGTALSAPSGRVS
jgi:hypothetical protein